jgi:hypothetical protein
MEGWKDTSLVQYQCDRGEGFTSCSACPSGKRRPTVSTRRRRSRSCNHTNTQCSATTNKKA